MLEEIPKNPKIPIRLKLIDKFSSIFLSFSNFAKKLKKKFKVQIQLLQLLEMIEMPIHLIEKANLLEAARNIPMLLETFLC